MKTLFQIMAVIAALGLSVGITYFCASGVLPRSDNRVASLTAKVDKTWGEIEDLRADMRELEERVSQARAEAYRASRALIDQAQKVLEKIPKGQGGPETPLPVLKDKKSSKSRR